MSKKKIDRQKEKQGKNKNKKENTMPENDVHTVTKEWLQSQLRSSNKSLIVLDCRSSNEFQEGHIRSAVNFSIPTLILKRLATGKIDINSTIKCRDLKQRIQNAYNDSVFVLYSDNRTDNSTEWNSSNETTTINVLHRRLKQDGCRVFCLKGNGIILHILV